MILASSQALNVVVSFHPAGWSYLSPLLRFGYFSFDRCGLDKGKSFEGATWGRVLGVIIFIGV